MDFYDRSLILHEERRGKLEIRSKVSLKNSDELSLAYTPGVAGVSIKIAANKADVYKYTIKGNSVAVVTDGSAVLGLGNIGPEAALPVMEGKAVLFKEFADVDAHPICLDTQDTEDIIKTIKHIAPGFGGINLEDIAAPRCFEIEERLQDLGIPVFHDDQHGTAIVVLAALINAAKVTGKKIEDLKIVINGAGAAGVAISKLLVCMNVDKNICTSVKDILLCDSKGIIHHCREDLNHVKVAMAAVTNQSCKPSTDANVCTACTEGTLKDALVNADVFIGVSKGNLLDHDMIKSMNRDPIIFAMANPNPEIMPEDAVNAGAMVVGTGRSDFPNQINNVLAFPGIFRGALDAGAKSITNEMKVAAAHAIASCVENPTKEMVVPSVLDRNVSQKVAYAVRMAHIESTPHENQEIEN